MADRRFSDREVGEILKIAAEMQSGVGVGTGEGMTLSELKRVAADIGLDPENIGRAASELAIPPKRDSSLLERTIEGELTEEGWEEMVNELRRFTGRPGKIELKGTTREWRGGSETEFIMLSATGRKGRTKLRLLANTSGAAGVAVTAGFASIFLALAPVIIHFKAHVIDSPWLVLATSITLVAIWIGLIVARLKSYRNNSAIRTGELLVQMAGIAAANTVTETPILSPSFDPIRVDEGIQQTT